MSSADPERRNSIVGGLMILFARGLLLWIVVPIGTVGRIFAELWLRRSGVRFLQYLGWIDLNLIAFLQRVVFRPLVRRPSDFVPARKMSSMTHRLRAIDPY
jgi:hypothetical protein